MPFHTTDEIYPSYDSTKSKAPPGQPVGGHHGFQGHKSNKPVDTKPSKPDKQEGPPGQSDKGHHFGYGNNPTGGKLLGSTNTDSVKPTIVIDNSNKVTTSTGNSTGNTTGNSTSSEDGDYKFKSITTKNNTFLNTEDDVVTNTWEKVQKLMKLNHGWTEIDAANFLETGSTDRKYGGKRGKEKQAGFNAAASNAITGGERINTWGMGIRGDYNFGKSMNLSEYSNGLDYVAANANQLSPEQVKIQRAILDSTKQFKKPSKFSKFFEDMPSVISILNKLKNIQPTRESFDTPVGSVGWDNLAIRQLKRGELMPDGSNPYKYLNKHENEEFKNLADKYTPGKGMWTVEGKRVWGKALSDYKPMTWWRERDLPQDEVDRRNAQLFEENLVGIEDDITGYGSQGEELFRTIKTELENSNIDAISNIRIDGDIVSLNEAFKEGPNLMSNANEIENSSVSSSVYQSSAEDTENQDTTAPATTSTTKKYIHPGDRAGGFEALFGIPYQAHEVIEEPQDTKTYRAESLANSGVTWDEYTGKYVYYDAALGQTAYYTPEEFRVQYNL